MNQSIHIYIDILSVTKTLHEFELAKNKSHRNSVKLWHINQFVSFFNMLPAR